MISNNTSSKWSSSLCCRIRRTRECTSALIISPMKLSQQITLCFCRSEADLHVYRISEWWTSCCQLSVATMPYCMRRGWPQKKMRRITMNWSPLCWGREVWSGLTRRGWNSSGKVKGIWTRRRQMRQKAPGSAASWHLSWLSLICNTTKVAPAVSQAHHHYHHLI